MKILLPRHNKLSVLVAQRHEMRLERGKALVADDMLDAAGVVCGDLPVYTERNEAPRQRRMPLVDPLAVLAAHVREPKRAALYREEAPILQKVDRAADAWPRHAHFRADVGGAHIGFLLG